MAVLGVVCDGCAGSDVGLKGVETEGDNLFSICQLVLVCDFPYLPIKLTVPSVESEVLTEPAGQPLPEVVRLAMVIRLASGAWRALILARPMGFAIAKAGRRRKVKECMAKRFAVNCESIILRVARFAG